MELKKAFETAYPPEAVWKGLSDVRLVAGCLPGASIVEELGPDDYKGRLQVKVGPLAASFAGLISIERRPAERVAVVTGKGADAKSSSRVTAKMTYRVQPSAATPGAARVDIDSDISLAGALAQFGKAAVMQEIAGRMTEEFVRRFEAQLAQTHADDTAAATAAADATEAPEPPAAPAAANVPPAAATAEAAAAVPAPPAPPRTATPPRPAPAAAPETFDAGNLLWSIFRQKVAAFFRRLFK